MEVSVIIPAYNAEAFIRKAVQSALFHPEVKQVIIVEDGSTDGTWGVCQQLANEDARITLVSHPNHENRGAGASRNEGIKQATQDYIAFLDADDYYTDIRFKTEKEIFKDNTHVDGVYGATGVTYLDEKGAQAWQKRGYTQTDVTTVNKVIAPHHLFEFLIGYKNKNQYSGYYTLDGFTVKKKALQKSGVLFHPALRLHQDTVFLWQLAYYLKLHTGEYEQPIAMRGVHAANRFIHKNKLYVSRSKQYKVLRNWALSEKLAPGIIKRLHLRFFRNVLRSKTKASMLLTYLGLVMGDSYTRSRFGKKQLKLVRDLLQEK